MIHKRIVLYAACLALAGVNFLLYAAAVPMQPAAQDQKHDLIYAVPAGIDAAFQNLQHRIADKLHAQQSKIDPRWYQIKQWQLNLTTNHRAGIPMLPHISLKGIPISRRQDAEDIFTPDLFSELAIPRSIRLVKLLALKSELPGHSDKLFIVADFADEPPGSLDNIANQLDEISAIARMYPYLHHITLAKLFPFSKGPQNISDRTVTDIQQILDDVWNDVGFLPEYNRDFPIDRIEYSYWQDDPSTARRPTVLWSRERAAAQPAAPTYRRAPEAARPQQRPPEPRRPQAAVPAPARTVYTYDQDGDPTMLSNDYVATIRNEEIEFAGSRANSAASLYKIFEHPGFTDPTKYSLMKQILREKFAHDPYRTVLLETDNALIIDYSMDVEWGYPDQNRLGQILMEVRDEIRGRTQAVPVQVPAAPARQPVPAAPSRVTQPQPAPAPRPAPQPQTAPAPAPKIAPRAGEQKFPLHAAIEAGDRALVARLIAEGADVNKTDAKGDSPLHVAADKGDLAIVQLLLNNNADIFALDANKLIPYVRAQIAKHHQVSDYLGKWKVECPVCMEEFKAVDLQAVGECGHRICEKDLSKIYERQGAEAVCPICRRPAYPQASHT